MNIDLRAIRRNFIKDRQFTLLNLIGLSTGLACTFFIYLWISDEWNIDKFHKSERRLYQVMAHISLPDGIHTQESTPGMLATALQEEMPEIEMAISIQPNDRAGILSIGTTYVKAKAQYVGKNFFEVFSFNLLTGKKEEVLADKYAAIVSDELAAKLFGTAKNAIGKTLYWNEVKEPYTVTGIFRKPVNSSMQFDLLLNYQLYFDKNVENLGQWGNSGPSTFFILKNETNIKQLKKKLVNYLKSKPGNSPLTLSLIRFSDKYLYGTYEDGIQAGGRIQYIRLFSIVALFVLFIACINFINLSTVKAARRSKEVGIKKVLGVRKFQLIIHYLAESLFMAFLSLMLAGVIVTILMPQFNLLTEKHISLVPGAHILMVALSITILTGLLAGVYPAFLLSGFKPVNILKGKIKTSLAEVMIRKGLVTFQFMMSVILIVSVLVFYRQMKLIRTVNLGYNKEQILSFRNDGQLRKHFSPFVEELKGIRGVSKVATLNGDMSGNFSGSTERIRWTGKKPTDQIHIVALDFDPEVIGMMEIKMNSGRSFSNEYQRDSLSIILNQAAVDAMGMQDPVGKKIEVWGSSYEIIGVTQNFHFESLYEKVKPCIIRSVRAGSNVLVKLQPLEMSATISSLAALYKKYNLGLPFEYLFLEVDYEAMYRSEEKVAIMFRYFAGLAIIISCLGLFGLAAFTSQKREKEIGIRKVIGATIQNILLMLIKDFLKPVVVGLLIAFPFAWLAMYNWLNGFAYHVRLSPLEFLAAGIVVVIITLLTISFQAIKAALLNPVRSLKAE